MTLTFRRHPQSTNTPDSLGGMPTSGTTGERTGNSRRGLWGGIAAVALTVTGVVVAPRLVGGGNETDPVATNNTETPSVPVDHTPESVITNPDATVAPDTVPNAPTAPVYTTDYEIVPLTDPYAGEMPPGNIDIRLLAAESNLPLITATRANGETIQVPTLADPNKDPELFAQTALGLMACFVTTGSQDCLEALTAQTKTQETLVALRDQVVGFYEKQDIPYVEDLQLVPYDLPNNPVSFEMVSGDSRGSFVHIKQGKLYFIYSSSPEWQNRINHDYTDPWALDELNQLDLFFDTRADGTPEITAINIDYNQAASS